MWLTLYFCWTAMLYGWLGMESKSGPQPIFIYPESSKEFLHFQRVVLKKKRERSCYSHYVWPAKVKIFTILPFIQKVCPPTLSSLLTGFGATVILQSWMQCQKNYAWNSPTNFHIPTIVLNVVARIRREFQKEKEGMVQTPLWFPPHPHLTYSSSKAYVHCYLTDPFPC